MEHTADLGLYIYGPDPAGIFTNAADVLFDLMLDRKTDGPAVFEPFSLTGLDYEDLLVNMLSELLYRFNARRQVVVRLHILGLNPNHLDGRLDLINFNPDRHHILMDIKAATYHLVECRPHGRGWRARVIFDI